MSLAMDEIRHFGEGSVQIARRLQAMRDDLLRIVPEYRKAPVERELRLLARANERAFADAEDRERASRPDAQGPGASPPSPAA